MRRSLLVVTLVLVGASATAQEGAGASDLSEVELQERIDAQIEAYDDALGRWAMEARARALTPSAELETRQPRVEDFAGPIWAIAEAHPRTAVARDALLWLRARLDLANAEDRERALALVLDNHLEHEGLTELCMRLSYEDGAGAVAGLRRLLEGSPHVAVRGLACYGLGRVLARDPARHEEAEAWLERARTEFGEVEWGMPGLVSARELSEKAVGDLFALRRLQVGLRAPDIEGADVDGVPFRLSDYAGKVVLLDFWGFW